MPEWFIDACGWAAYAFGPVIGAKLVWDTWRRKAYNTYTMLGMWVVAESIALYYNVERTGAIPIIANCIATGGLMITVGVIQIFQGRYKNENRS
jgi:hypothetical protein